MREFASEKKNSCKVSHVKSERKNSCKHFHRYCILNTFHSFDFYNMFEFLMIDLKTIFRTYLLLISMTISIFKFLVTSVSLNLDFKNFFIPVTGVSSSGIKAFVGSTTVTICLQPTFEIHDGDSEIPC